jgi:hypothetical protein
MLFLAKCIAFSCILAAASAAAVLGEMAARDSLSIVITGGNGAGHMPGSHTAFSRYVYNSFTVLLPPLWTLLSTFCVFHKTWETLFPHKTQLISFKAPPSMIYFLITPIQTCISQVTARISPVPSPAISTGMPRAGNATAKANASAPSRPGSRLYPTNRDF